MVFFQRDCYSRGQISLDFSLAVLFAIALFFALFPMVESIQQNSFLSSARFQERVIADQVAAKIPLVQSLSPDENFSIQTSRVKDANQFVSPSDCQIKVSKNMGDSTGSVFVFYPANNPSFVSASFALDSSFQLVGSPVLAHCGCITLSRFANDSTSTNRYFGVGNC